MCTKQTTAQAQRSAAVACKRSQRFAARSSVSSPFVAISSTMSAPPTNSPSMYSCSTKCTAVRQTATGAGRSLQIALHGDLDQHPTSAVLTKLYAGHWAWQPRTKT